MHEVQSTPTERLIQGCTAQHVGDRSEQQDRVALLASDLAANCALAVLADGVGGMSGGALAAASAIEVSRHCFARFDPRTTAPSDFLRSLVAEIHTVVRLDAMTAELKPHTTFAAVLMQRARADWCHVGDSRIHQVRAARLLHRTSDHTYAQELASQHGLGAAAASRHPLAQRLVNAIGASREPVPTLGSDTTLRAGDCFLLCSDGLWGYISETELARTVTLMTPRGASEALIDAARTRARGRGDNCSLVMLKLCDPQSAPTLEPALEYAEAAADPGAV